MMDGIDMVQAHISWEAGSALARLLKLYTERMYKYSEV